MKTKKYINEWISYAQLFFSKPLRSAKNFSPSFAYITNTKYTLIKNTSMSQSYILEYKILFMEWVTSSTWNIYGRQDSWHLFCLNNNRTPRWEKWVGSLLEMNTWNFLVRNRWMSIWWNWRKIRMWQVQSRPRCHINYVPHSLNKVVKLAFFSLKEN